MHSILRHAARLIAFCLLSSMLFTGCITAPKHRPRSDQLSTADKKIKLPRNYSLFSHRQVNERLLLRGQREMANPALDSY